MEYNTIYHLSHIDLDGYGSQYMTYKLAKKNNINVYFFNVDYVDILSYINKILSLIVENNKKNKNEKILFMISDLSINEKIAKKINNFFRGNNHIDLTVQALDHHKSNKEVWENNDWYLCDLSRCGASITSDFINNFHNIQSLKEHLTFVGKFIQSHDIFEENNENFGKANLLADIIFNIHFMEEFQEEKRLFLFEFIFYFTSLCENKKLTVFELEQELPNIINITLKKFIKNDSILNNDDIRTLYKVYYYQSELFTRDFKKFDMLEYMGQTFKVLFNNEPGFFQYFSHYVLNEHNELDFIMNINIKGKGSLRSNGEVDVDVIAKNLNNTGRGGGHKNASGLSIDFKQPVHSVEELQRELELLGVNIKK